MDLETLACITLLSFWMGLLASGVWTYRTLKNEGEE